MGIELNIQQWNAWLPGVHGASACQQWAAGTLALTPGDKPDVSVVPAMLRRRLNEVGRLVAAVVWELIPEASDLPMVFCSRHGDQARTLQLMSELSTGEPLSPAAFSMSVHNAVAGVLSIAKNARGPMTAIAAQDQLMSMGLLEAWAQLQQGATEVLLVVYDLPLPPEYNGESDLDHPFALALRLTRSGGRPVRGDMVASAPGPRPNRQYDGLTWLRWLAGDAAEVVLDGESQGWRWAK
jgi:hypothetical protein